MSFSIILNYYFYQKITIKRKLNHIKELELNKLYKNPSFFKLLI